MDTGNVKRKTKTGSGDRVERTFLCESGLAALVTQTPGLLAVEMIKPSFIELDIAMKARLVPTAKPKSDKPQSLEARADSANIKRVKAIFAACEEDEEDIEYIHLIDEASLTPLGSPLRVAIGNQFIFELPPTDWDEEPYLEIISKSGYPSPDHPHRLEKLSDKFESPNESCTHILHLEPSAGIDFLLSNGFAYNPKQDITLVDPIWAAPILGPKK